MSRSGSPTPPRNRINGRAGGADAARCVASALGGLPASGSAARVVLDEACVPVARRRPWAGARATPFASRLGSVSARVASVALILTPGTRGEVDHTVSRGPCHRPPESSMIGTREPRRLHDALPDQSAISADWPNRSSVCDIAHTACRGRISTKTPVVNRVERAAERPDVRHPAGERLWTRR
jgi:hypothetical protein